VWKPDSLLAEKGDEIAAVIVEPLQRIIPTEDGYLAALKSECDAYGILLILDEIVTGFRLDYVGAQERYGVVPDICTLGKIMGAGFPLAASGARREIMDHFDKSKVGAKGWLMQMGSLFGNPVAAAAGLKTMEILRRPGTYEKLREFGTRLMNMLSDALGNAGISHKIVGDETLFDVLFTDKPVRDYRDTQKADSRRNCQYNLSLRQQGIFKSPGKMYSCLALTDIDFEQTQDAVNKAALLLG